ncbi:MAG: 50S ribosomal protein L37ae [Candidatus Woesearchaeota archaeon]
MKKAINTGSTKRFGSRYGKTGKDKVEKIEAEQRKNHKCPYCSRVSVRRESAGIWVCTKCNSKFTSKAYTVAKLPKLKVTVSEI